MSDKAQGESSPTAGPSDEALEFLQSLSLVFTQSSLYGLDHSVTAGSVDRSFAVLTKLLRTNGSVSLAVAEEDLLVNGAPLQSKTPAITTLMERLAKLEVASFSLERGIPVEQYKGLIELFHAKPEEMQQAGGFATVLSTLGLSHVGGKKVTFQRVTEDEVVVSKEKLSAAAGGVVDGEVLAAFLRGDETAGEKGAPPPLNIESAVANLAELSRVILKVAGVEEKGVDDETIDRVVSAIRRLSDKLQKSPKAQTQKGKKEVIHLLEELEKEVIAGLESRSAGNVSAVSKVTEAMEEMRDAMRLDAISTEYARKRSAIEASEKRILRYLKRVGEAALNDTSLKSKLLADGLTEEGWQDLLDRAGISTEDQEGADASETEERAVADRISAELSLSLAALVGAVEGTPEPGIAGAGAGVGAGAGTDGGAGAGGAMVPGGIAGIAGPAPGGGGQPPEIIGSMITHVGEAVAGLAAVTERRIRTFAKKAGARGGAGAGKRGMGSRALMVMLAEIVQELRQPLSVVTSVVDGLQLGMLGPLEKTQKELLTLVDSSAKRLAQLIDKLAEVAGMPDGLTPDAKVLDSVYNR